VDVREIAPGLWRWTAPHPEWEAGAEPESPGDWPEKVGCVLLEPRDGVAVLVDPQLPAEPTPFWTWADERVRGCPAFVVTTIEWHGRSRNAFVERYATTELTPAHVRLLPFPSLGETIVWLPPERTLVPGDRIIGAGGGNLRLCPESWLRYLPGKPTLADMREMLGPLLDLPVERVLVSHGEPVLSGGADALANAFA
jgi:hypothetical protein